MTDLIGAPEEIRTPDPQIRRLLQAFDSKALFCKIIWSPPIPPTIGGGKWDDLAMKTTMLAYVIALGGVAMIVFGLWGHYYLIKERASELRLRENIPTILTIAVGFVLIGLARVLELLLVIFHEMPHAM